MHVSTIIPKWYAEDKFLESGAISAVSDTTHSFIFGRLYKTPTNQTFRDGNHLRINFCHLEFPCDSNSGLADPPTSIAQTVMAVYSKCCDSNNKVVARCMIDCTLQSDKVADELVAQFEKAGFACERGLVDTVMLLSVDEQTRNRTIAADVRRLSDESMLDALVECNAKSFGYDKTGDTAWLHEKLVRQIRKPQEFFIYVVSEEAKNVLSFVIIYRPIEKADDLAFVQAIGTHPDHRRHGLAKAVLQYALSQLPVAIRIYLEAFEEGPMALYKQLGFKKVGKIYSTDCMLLPK
ncbi:hypothetical protein GGI25_001080 [Coemansia spiralis]|uniref:N-acetyltransferase domain-containing protein n=2 Tax=Coemansia TaxID=4863 RepID=A0A9W8L0C6_9FUNG|nr:hypothetical protein BX070DRAFT_237730 [Coemansia spiralis]KAJ1995512.1 hypothetical protein EDC05_000750 [Coemansia umbellata]KAJ2625155.1 hypothetical protein GGI26_000958 [Coemansia sp. RSA 1358]KAJ2679891.1 hypothetical protein GGI25_001080 [Coemansia spiralis]